MRGIDVRSDSLFSYVSCEARVPATHPLRPIRAMVDKVLEVLSPNFEEMYSTVGRPSIPSEKLLQALLLQMFYLIRSGRNAERDFRGEKRSNQTHASTTDPDAKLYRKADGQPSRLAFMRHVLMEDRNGLVVGTVVTQATGTAEREAALAMIDAPKPQGRITLGADKVYDVCAFVKDLRARTVTPHITRHPGYAVSLRIRKRIEEVFGWIKAATDLRKTRHKGTDRVGWVSPPERRRLQPRQAAQTDARCLTTPGLRLKSAETGKNGRKPGPQPRPSIVKQRWQMGKGAARVGSSAAC